MIPTDANLAKREVVRRVISNHENLTRFALRGVGSPGQPSVSAPLAGKYSCHSYITEIAHSFQYNNWPLKYTEGDIIYVVLGAISPSLD